MIKIKAINRIKRLINLYKIKIINKLKIKEILLKILKIMQICKVIYKV